VTDDNDKEIAVFQGMILRTHPAARYFVALAATVAAYVLYSLIVVPCLEARGEPRSRRNVDFSNYETPLDDKGQHAELFQADDWELKLCKTLETPQGKIFFQDYMPQADGTWDVFPFTMILAF